MLRRGEGQRFSESSIAFGHPVIKMIRFSARAGQPHSLVALSGGLLRKNGLVAVFFRRNTGFSAFVHSGLSHYMLCAYLPGNHSTVSRKSQIATISHLSTWACS